MSLVDNKPDEKIIDDFFVGIYNRILVLEEKWLKKQGLEITIAEAHMLVAIALREHGTMGEVTEAVSLTNGTVTTMVKKLEAKGYVARVRDGADKRILRVALTDKGKLVNEVHKKFHTELTNAVLESIDENEKKMLLKTMEKIHFFFSNLR